MRRYEKYHAGPAPKGKAWEQIRPLLFGGILGLIGAALLVGLLIWLSQ